MEREITWLLEEKYQGKLTLAAKKDIAKLKKGEHIDYVIGFVDFAGCRIDLSRKPLIPRPETEYWTLQAIEELKKDKRKNIRCLDIFAGSGCIGIAVLKHTPKVRVDFAEKEPRFIRQIKINLRKNGISKRRVCVLQSDVFSGVKGMYDYIFANPPYVAESSRASVQPSVLKVEPQSAVFAGKDGLRYIKKFLKEAKAYLQSGGKIYLEFDSAQRNEINEFLNKFSYLSWQFRKDHYGKWRFIVVKN